MRWPLLSCALLAACGGATPPAPSFVDTGDPLPVAVDEAAACEAAGGFRWLGLDPHVPLAVTGPDGVASAEACCAGWARTGDTWTAVDAWGAPLGDVTITGGEGYDVTQCYELGFDDAPAGAVAFVRGDSAWTAPPSARWEPSPAERDALLALATSLDAALAPQAFGTDAPTEPLRPIAERVVFFTIPDRHSGGATRFAAFGGRALVIAGLDSSGAWRLHHLDPSWGLSAGPWLAEPYRVLGVLDVDGDGVAELLVHRQDGPSWDDAILKCNHDDTLRTWTLVAESVGGSTA